MVVVMMCQRKVGVGAELERTTKMECENESENDHFLCHSRVDSRFHFQK